MPELERVKQAHLPTLQSTINTPSIPVATLETNWCMLLIPVVTPLTPELERIIKQEEITLRHNLILRFLEAGLPFYNEVEVRARGCLFCFSDLQIES